MANESTREYDQRAEKAGGMTGKVLTPAEVTEILARAEAAQSGPWDFDPPKEADKYHEADKFTWVNGPSGPIFGTAGRARISDAVFVAHARTDIHALCVTITRLRGLIEGMEHEANCNSEQHYVHVEPCPFWTKHYCLDEFEGESVGCHPAACDCIQSKVDL